jgi:o-succinylbenzoate---CoA ligase
MPVNWRLNPSEVAWQLRDAGIQVLLFDQDCEAYVAEVNKELRGQIQACCLSLESIATPQVSRSHIDLLRTHAIIYTSGTTGHPKGTLLTYQNHFWSAISSGLQLGVLPTDKWLVPMPLFHVGGLAVLMRSVIYGTTAVIQDHFDVETVNATLDRGDISMVSLVPVMLQRMLVNRSEAYAPSLRCILLGGSAAPRPLLETCQALRIPVAQSYGLTETDSQVATLQPADGLRKLGSSGKPLLPTEIAIVDGDNRLPHGEVGEIAVKGPTVTSGYLNRPDTTRDAIRNGWLHTGDIGYLDEDGYLYVLDRRSDLIVSGGENIYPAEVESALTAHEAVLEAAVTGKSDETWAAVPVAFVKLRVGATVTPEELQVFCRTRLGGYKVPKEIHFVQELPRNAGGKLLRRKLKDWVNS